VRLREAVGAFKVGYGGSWHLAGGQVSSQGATALVVTAAGVGMAGSIHNHNLAERSSACRCATAVCVLLVASRSASLLKHQRTATQMHGHLWEPACRRGVSIICQALSIVRRPWPAASLTMGSLSPSTCSEVGRSRHSLAMPIGHRRPTASAVMLSVTAGTAARRSQSGPQRPQSAAPAPAAWGPLMLIVPYR